MKKLFTIIAAAFLFFCIGCTKQAEVKQSAASVIAQKYAPENSMAFLRFSSIEKLFTTFNVKPESVMGESVTEDRSEMIKTMGFDPMNLAEYDKIGFDTKKEFGFVMSTFKADTASIDKSQANFGFFVPVKDKSNAYKYVKETLEKNKEEGVVITESNGMISITSAEEKNFLVTIKADTEYMIFSFSLNSQETAEVFLNASAHLADSPNYKEVSGSVDLASDAAFYMNFKSFFTANEQAFSTLTLNPMFGQNELKSVGFLKFYRGFGMAADLSKSDLLVNAATFIDAGNPLNKLIENTKADKSVILDFEKKPALLLAFMINASEYLNFYLNSAPEEVKNEVESKIAETNQSLGIDIRKDLIDQLAGSINLGIYDGANVNMMQYNTVINFNVRNSKAFIALLEKTKATTGMTLVEKSQYEQLFQIVPKSENITVYSIFMGMAAAYVVIEGDNVSVLTTKDYVGDIMNKDNPKFIDKADKIVADKLKNDQNYLYVDFTEAYLAAKNIYQLYLGMSGGENQLDAKADNFAKNFDYLYAGGNYKGEKATAEFIVKTKFQKPFFVALMEEFDKLKPAK
jgi:hypothetical protein